MQILPELRAHLLVRFGPTLQHPNLGFEVRSQGVRRRLHRVLLALPNVGVELLPHCVVLRLFVFRSETLPAVYAVNVAACLEIVHPLLQAVDLRTKMNVLDGDGPHRGPIVRPSELELGKPHHDL
jgi:hypothetical protein